MTPRGVPKPKVEKIVAKATEKHREDGDGDRSVMKEGVINENLQQVTLCHVMFLVRQLI